VLGLNFLLLKKYRYLFLLAFLFVWLYDAFPLLVIMAAVYFLALWLIEGELELRPLVFVSLGVTFGLLINPYFPDNIIFGARHLIPKLLGEADIRVGNEWYPYETTQLLSNTPLGLLFFLSGVFALGLNNRRMDTRTAAGLLLSIFFGLMLFQSRRFIEYFPPFALIFTAFAWAPIIDRAGYEPRMIFPVDWKSKRFLPGVFLSVMILAGTWFSARAAQENLLDTKPASMYSVASEWLIDHTPQGTRIFQTDWDDFPRLFFHNTWNTYLIGLDPTYMQLKDPQLFERWVAITRGEVEDPSQQIFEAFSAQYVLTDLAHKQFIDQAGKDPAMVEVYRDQDALIYQINLGSD